VNCIVTAGPTFELLDEVRLLTNFSTGHLGIELARYLQEQGCRVTLLIGRLATWAGERRAHQIEEFTTTQDLQKRLAARAGSGFEAVFHAAAVSDFTFGKVWSRSAAGELAEVQAGKISTRSGSLLAELTPTPKIISRLREWFPQARLAGWKYEVDGDPESTLARAREQIEANRTDACVANGPAYGPGFGWVTREAQAVHLADHAALLAELGGWLALTPLGRG
jgi:phosphopantothenate---cysteine ligase (CTP)